MQFWNELEGRIVEGYPLRRLVRSEGRTAWFETEIHEGGVRPAIISLTESLTDADEVTQRLEAAQRLKHPNLVAILKIGRATIDQTLFVYAVMENTDQDLSDVLRGQTLSKEEARQVAEALTGALTAIHREGLVHGRVEPASVLAVGDAVKLRSDCLQSPGGSRAGDVAGIGAILFQAFTQRRASSADDAQINRIPAPFGEIVRNSLSSRWSLAQIATLLHSPTAPVTPPPAADRSIPAPAAARIAPPGIAPKPRPITPVQPAAAQKPAFEASPIQREEKVEHPIPRRPFALYAGIAIIVVVVLAWLLFRPRAHPPASTGSSNPPVAPAPFVPATKPSPEHGATRQHEAPVEGTAAPPGARSGWKVIVYTYRRQDQAQHKADEINQAHPDLEASVFAPKGSGEPYLVTLGGSMNGAQAFRMRTKALSSGLPLDTYVQNFSK